MRILSFLRKSIKENIRDWKILVITLIMAPIYVLITYTVYHDANQSYSIIVSNLDKGIAIKEGSHFNVGDNIVSAMEEAHYSDKKKVFAIRVENDVQKGQKRLKDRSAEIMIIIPEDFSQSMLAHMAGESQRPALIIYGDEASPQVMMARVLADVSIYEVVMTITKTDLPIAIVSKPIENAKAPTPFGAYIPGLLALSLVSLMFTAVASIIKEVDKGTIRRIKISRLKPIEFLSAISLTQAILSIPVILLTYLTAFSLGYRPTGSLITLLVVGLFSSFSIMGISLMIASFINTIFELMTVGSLPYFILLFFSGAWFPMPAAKLFAIAGHPIGITDILPISHTVSAMNKILNYGAGLSDVFFEFCAILILTIFYYTAGVFLFNRKHMKFT